MPCFPSLSDLPEPPDAVVVAIPAAGVAAVVEEAGAIGCGGAVVYGAGFGEIAKGAALERELARPPRGATACPSAARTATASWPLHERVALWGDALRPLEPGRVALVSQSGNVAVNTLATRRGLRLHTVISCGNSAALDPADWIAQLAREEGVGSIAVYLEADGDGARLVRGARRMRRARRGRVRAQGGRLARRRARGRGAHRRGGGRPARVPRARGGGRRRLGRGRARAARAGEGAGRAGRSPADAPGGGGLGGAHLLGRGLRARRRLLRPQRPRPSRRWRRPPPTRLRELLPDAATVGNPLDYTALIWGEVDTLRDIVADGGERPGDRPGGGALRPARRHRRARPRESWAAVREGIHAGAAASPVPVMVASTLPELLDDDARPRASPTPAYPRSPGSAPAWSAPRRCAQPRPPTRRGCARSRPRAATQRRTGAVALAEHEAKDLLRSAGVPVVEGRLAAGEDEAAAAHGGPRPGAGAEALGARAACTRASSARSRSTCAAPRTCAPPTGASWPSDVDSAAVLVERMEPPARRAARRRAPRRAWCPRSWSGSAACGPRSTTTWRWSRCPPRPSAWRRRCAHCAARASSPAPAAARRSTCGAAARLGCRVGDLLLAEGLALIELNPVLVHEHGALAVDALAG